MINAISAVLHLDNENSVLVVFFKSVMHSSLIAIFELSASNSTNAKINSLTIIEHSLD